MAMRIELAAARIALLAVALPWAAASSIALHLPPPARAVTSMRNLGRYAGRQPAGASYCENLLAYQLLRKINRGDTVVDKVAVFMIGLPGSGKVRAHRGPTPHKRRSHFAPIFCRRAA